MFSMYVYVLDDSVYSHTDIAKKQGTIFLITSGRVNRFLSEGSVCAELNRHANRIFTIYIYKWSYFQKTNVFVLLPVGNLVVRNRSISTKSRCTAERCPPSGRLKVFSRGRCTDRNSNFLIFFRIRRSIFCWSSFPVKRIMSGLIAFACMFPWRFKRITYHFLLFCTE